MDDNTSISDEQLAYLNANLDLVSKYMNNHYLTFRVSEDKLHNCVFVDRDTYYDRVRAHTCTTPYFEFKIGGYQYPYIWRELLQFVEDNQTTHPIFK